VYDLAVFYSDSNKILLNLQQNTEQKCLESSRTRLKKHCTTRWVEKQDAVLLFHELYPAVVASLDDIAVWPGDSGSKGGGVSE